MKTLFHTVAPGDIVLADRGVVLELVLGDAAGMIIYDRARKLACAAVMPAAQEAGRPEREWLGRVSLATLSRMLKAGCRAERLEIYALGAPFSIEPASALLDRATRATRAFRQARVALAYGPPGAPAALRAEFDVDLGRIVLEQPDRSGGD